MRVATVGDFASVAKTFVGNPGGTTMRGVILATAAALALATAGWQEAKKKQPKADVGAGRVAWFDITTTKMATAKDFYSKLFGWTFKAFPGMDVAAEIECEGKSIGTLRVAEGKISPYDGVVYIQVNDLPACCKK